jgi:curved DNA-binding protein CbpA
MTDYFALLEQPRAPWLDPAALKETYRRKTLQSHPDTTAADADTDFAQVNEAYQVLQDPKRRLHHLLSLENVGPASANQVVPGELQDLFLLIGASNQRTTLLLEKIRTTSNALGRSLLKPEILAAQEQVAVLRDKVRNLEATADERLREINVAWEQDRSAQVTELANLSSRFAYLSRWSAQLDELAFQLTLD